MSDLSTRARQIATKQGLVFGNEKTAKDRLTFDMIAALASLDAPQSIPSPVLARALFDMAALCSLYGIDIVDGVQAAIEQREITGRPIVPGTLAPVPNAKTNDGTLRDPSGKEPEWE